MSNILVCGLANVETSCAVREFPIAYSPIDYNFFGVTSSASGVGLNVALALTELGDDISLISFAAGDPAGSIVREASAGISNARLASCVDTPQSVVLFDKSGRRRVYTDLKDMQEQTIPEDMYADIADHDACCLCNINFSRPLLEKAKAASVPIFSDVHCLSDIRDEYNADFMRYADVLFLSNEYIAGREETFVRELAAAYPCGIIVVGMGSRGSLLYERSNDSFTMVQAIQTRPVVNTVGAGDALFSAFTHFYVKGKSALESLRYASLFASHKIGESGASKGFISERELDKLYAFYNI